MAAQLDEVDRHRGLGGAVLVRGSGGDSHQAGLVPVIHGNGGIVLRPVDVQALIAADTPLYLLAGVLGADFRIDDYAGILVDVHIDIAAGNLLAVSQQIHPGHPGNQNQLQLLADLVLVQPVIGLDGNGLALQDSLGIGLQYAAGRQIGIARIVRVNELPQENLVGVAGVLGSQGECLTGQNLTLLFGSIRGGGDDDGAQQRCAKLGQLVLQQLRGLLGRIGLLHGSLGCFRGLRGRGGLGRLRSGSGGFGSRGFRSLGHCGCLSGFRNSGSLGGLRNHRGLRLLNNSGFRLGYILCQCLEGHQRQKHHHCQKQGKNTLAHRSCLLILLATIIVVTICTDCNISVIRLQP